jgi:hypothetical protein
MYQGFLNATLLAHLCIGTYSSDRMFYYFVKLLYVSSFGLLNLFFICSSPFFDSASLLKFFVSVIRLHLGNKGF